MLRIAICEDNPIHTDRLTDMLKQILDKQNEQYEEIDTFSGSDEFSQAMSSKDMLYNLIFMDIELGNSSGIDLGRKINTCYPGIPIIFISQYLEYVSSVYETEHIYFINKETMETYLPKAINKALKILQNPEEQYLTFCWRNEKFTIPQKDILYMERQQRTTTIHTTTQTFTTSEKLTALEGKLTNWLMICHRSYIINLKHVTELKRYYVVIENNTIVSVSRSRYEEVKRRLCTLL